MPETRDEDASGHVDYAGSALGVIGLGGITAGVIAAADHGITSLSVFGPAVVGVLAFVVFVIVEHRQKYPMLPLSLFRSRQFSAANAVTFFLYAANGGSLLLLVVELQTVSGFSPLAAGVALLPITVMMLLFAARFGALAQRIGPRIPMTVGPLVSAVGLALFVRVLPGTSYLSGVLPGAVVFGLGMVLTVPALTTTAMGSVKPPRAGVASAVNNDVARIGSLIAVAVVPTVAALLRHTFGRLRGPGQSGCLQAAMLMQLRPCPRSAAWCPFSPYGRSDPPLSQRMSRSHAR